MDAGSGGTGKALEPVSSRVILCPIYNIVILLCCIHATHRMVEFFSQF
jgi:hypothetical protein